MNTDTPYPEIDRTEDRSGDSHSMFGWYGHLRTNERRAFWSCKIGYALDAMDTQFLSFVIPALIATWGLTKGEAGLIGTVTLLSRAGRSR